MKRRVLTFLCLGILSMLLLGACSLGVPEGFSKKNYEKFVEIYREYEHARANNIADNQDLGEIWKYRKMDEKGELSPQESQVYKALSNLILMYTSSYKDLDDSTYDIVTLIPHTLSIELTGGDIREVKKKEDMIRSYLKLKAKPANKKVEDNRKKAYKQATNFISKIAGLGEDAEHIGYENSYVTYRKSSKDYYIASIFSYKQKDYKYEMIVDSKMNFVDAYLVDSVAGPFSKPMNKDRRPNLPDLTKKSDQESPVQDRQSTIEGDAPPKSSSTAEEEWEKKQFLGTALQSISDLLGQVQQHNQEAMSLKLDSENLEQVLQTLEIESSNLSLMTQDPETKKYLTDTDNQMIGQILTAIDELAKAERQIISDSSTQTIRVAEGAREEAVQLVDGLIKTID